MDPDESSGPELPEGFASGAARTHGMKDREPGVASGRAQESLLIPSACRCHHRLREEHEPSRSPRAPDEVRIAEQRLPREATERSERIRPQEDRLVAEGADPEAVPEPRAQGHEPEASLPRREREPEGTPDRLRISERALDGGAPGCGEEHVGVVKQDHFPGGARGPRLELSEETGIGVEDEIRQQRGAGAGGIPASAVDDKDLLDSPGSQAPERRLDPGLLVERGHDGRDPKPRARVPLYRMNWDTQVKIAHATTKSPPRADAAG